MRRTSVKARAMLWYPLVGLSRFLPYDHKRTHECFKGIDEVCSNSEAMGCMNNSWRRSSSSGTVARICKILDAEMDKVST